MTVPDRLGRVVNALHEIARTLESAEGFEARILRALELLRDILPCDRCAFFEASTNGKHDLLVTPVASSAQRKRLDVKLNGLFRLITEDEEPAGCESSVQAPTTEHAHLALPVIGMDQTIGVLFIEADSDEPFGEESLRLLSLVAAQLGGYLVTLRALQKEARTGDALARANEFQQLLVGRVSHELRNPVAAIRNGAALVLRRSTDEANIKTLEVMQACAERCARVIADLVGVSRDRAAGTIRLQRRRMNLSDAIVRVVDEYRLSHPGRAIHFDDSAEPLVGAWDPDRLSQLFSSLLSNAVTHSPLGTDVRVSARRHETEAQVSVHNKGPAITDDVMPTIFDPFKQVRSNAATGLGLGLYLVKQIVDALDGTVRVSSTVKDGTTFTVVLPLAS